jgi:CheY-like chemotaxis protein
MTFLKTSPVPTVLSELGYRVSAAADAHLALAEMEKLGGVHLLFTDVGLPNGINGRQLADEVHRRWPDVKVFFRLDTREMPSCTTEGSTPG